MYLGNGLQYLNHIVDSDTSWKIWGLKFVDVVGDDLGFKLIWMVFGIVSCRYLS